MNISENERKLNLYKTERIPFRAAVSYYSGDLKKFMYENNSKTKIIQTSTVLLKPRDILVLEWF